MISNKRCPIPPTMGNLRLELRVMTASKVITRRYEVIRSQVPKVTMIRLWERFNDWKGLGLKSLISSYDDLRYSLAP